MADENKFNIVSFYNSLSDKDKQMLGPRADSIARFCQYDIPFKLTLKHAPKTGKILDWGCGNGFYSYFLLTQGYQDIVGYSFDKQCPAVLSDYRAFRYAQGLEGEPVKLPFDSGIFDSVLSVGVLEHVHQGVTAYQSWETPRGGDQTASALEINRILKPGGFFLIFNLPNKYSWTLLKKSSRIKHDKRFDKNSICKLMEESGFVIENMGRYGGLPRNATTRLPVFKNKAVSRVYNKLNNLMELALPIISTNWFVVARKPY